MSPNNQAISLVFEHSENIMATSLLPIMIDKHWGSSSTWVFHLGIFFRFKEIIYSSSKVKGVWRSSVNYSKDKTAFTGVMG